MIAAGDRKPETYLMPLRCYFLETPIKSASGGFTLVELIVVIFIISMTAALIMPSLWDRGERAINSESRRISNTLRYIYDEAMGKKQTYNLKIDLDKDEWSYKSKSESRNFELKDNVMFRDIIVPSVGKVSFGEVIIPFGPLGPEEPVTVHLIKNDKESTIIFNNITGRTKVYEGYKE
jgi:general secretion pathway protein H